MNNGLSPGYLVGGINNGSFSSTPFNATLTANTGIGGTNNNMFYPDTAQTGFHQITYTYDTLGCSFQTSDIIQVLDASVITIDNLIRNYQFKKVQVMMEIWYPIRIPLYCIILGNI